jgi:hypothetical protein
MGQRISFMTSHNLSTQRTQRDAKETKNQVSKMQSLSALC